MRADGYAECVVLRKSRDRVSEYKRKIARAKNIFGVLAKACALDHKTKLNSLFAETHSVMAVKYIKA